MNTRKFEFVILGAKHHCKIIFDSNSYNIKQADILRLELLTIDITNDYKNCTINLKEGMIKLEQPIVFKTLETKKEKIIEQIKIPKELLKRINGDLHFVGWSQVIKNI